MAAPDNAPSFAGAWNDFVLGIKGKFPSLEEALTHRSAERRLINLHDPQTRYDPARHTVTYQRDGAEHAIRLDPAFRGYMRRYASKTHYVTDKGTPWLTRKQEYRQSISKKQLGAYYAALNKGENREVVMVNWSGTHIYRNDSGHSSLSVGTLNLADGSSEEDEIPLYRYEPEITGSYYGSLGPVMRIFPDAYRASTDAKVVDHSPRAHAMGTMLRDGAWPLSAMLASMAVGTMVTAKGLKNKDEHNRLIKTTLRAMTGIAATATAGIATGYLANSNGTLLMKEETIGSGLLATLITPAQRDILEHALYGVYKTYEGKYNILHSNCADFSEKMLAEIQVDITSVIESAMQQEPPKSVLGRVRDVLSVPQHIRPERNSWALRVLPDSKPVTGVVTLDPLPIEHVPHRFTDKIRRNGKANGGEELHISPNVATSAPTLLVETTKQKFDRPPIETFREVLKHVTLRADKQGKYRWELMPHVQLLEKEAAQNRPR